MGAVLAALILAGLVSCKSSSKNNSTGDGPNVEYNNPEDNFLAEVGITDFAGLTAVENITDVSVLLKWDYHEQISRYVILRRESGAAKFKAVAYLDGAQTSYLQQNLKNDTAYEFKIRAYNELGQIDDNTSVQTVHTFYAPSTPAAVTLVLPLSSEGFMRRPIFSVRYVKGGDTVRLFSDASCTQEIGRGVVGADQNVIELALAADLTPGPYTIYANSTNLAGHASACSVAYASYTFVECPEGYVVVDGDVDLAVDSFCVMPMEARQGDGNLPVVSAADLPWSDIYSTTAKTNCQLLSTEDIACDLISNPQWMAIARSIETTAANWSGGEVGQGVLNRGHSDNDPATHLAITDPSDPWSDTNNDESDWTQKRTHTLNNGGVLWDLAGNLYEWVDWTTGGDVLSRGPNSCNLESTDLFDVDCPALSPNDYLPLNPAGISPLAYNAVNYNLGRFFGNISGQGYVARGEGYNKGIKAGIYALSFDNNTNTHGPTGGFRCACRLK